MIRTVFCDNHFMSATKSVAILLTMVGTNVYRLVHDLLASEKPADKVYRKIVALNERAIVIVAFQLFTEMGYYNREPKILVKI